LALAADRPAVGKGLIVRCCMRLADDQPRIRPLLSRIVYMEATVRHSFRDSFRSITPPAMLSLHRHWQLNRRAKQLNALLGNRHDTASRCQILWQFREFRPFQKTAEIIRLCELIEKTRPQRICEIGAADGGTTCLFAQVVAPDATLISVDLSFSRSRQSAVKRFARFGQKLFCLQADSHRAETLEKVQRCLGGQQLDVLFIDGDHSYEGVSADFNLYSSLVRDGGIIILHDIVPDFRTCYGIQTSADVGGVPQFWKEVKTRYSRFEEIIEDKEQDGYGIGIIWKQGAVNDKIDRN